MKYSALALLLGLSLGLGACSTDSVFDERPTERTTRYVGELRQRLVSAPYGWQMTYFPRVDSLLFRNPTERLADTEVQQDRYGYGGYNLVLRFASGGGLELMSDLSTSDPSAVHAGAYDIRLGSSLQLSFTTHTPLHELVSSELEGVSDFVYRYRDYEGRLIFSTGQSTAINRPYVVLTPLVSAEMWGQTTALAVAHRQYFERMTNPQLRIRHGSRLLFQSDVPFRDSRGDQRKLLERNRRRYHVFLARRDRHDLLSRGGYNALGSGYVGTAWGLSFRPGFGIDNRRTFYDFERRGDRFVCELVSVYDTDREQFVLASKHLYPEGEPTNYIAEIIDEK